MACFTWVNEKRRCTGTCKSCRHLFTDVTGFAHTHDNDFALAIKHFFTGRREVCVDVLPKLIQAFTFDLQYFFTCLLKVKTRL